jgi:hypothetical protein
MQQSANPCGQERDRAGLGNLFDFLGDYRDGSDGPELRRPTNVAAPVPKSIAYKKEPTAGTHEGETDASPTSGVSDAYAMP